MRLSYTWAALAATLLLGACASSTTSESSVKVPEVVASVSQVGTVSPPPSADPSVLPPLQPGDTAKVNLVLLDRDVIIAPGVRYHAWTFNGAVPGPVIHVKVGQTVDVTLTNNSSLGHSIDFHAALAPPDVAYQTIQVGQQLHFQWVARYPGVFLYHCGTPPVLMHIANGMYGAVIVDPENGWPDGDMQSYVLLQSEFYTQPWPGHPGVFWGNMQKMEQGLPDHVMFNGMADLYVGTPLPITVNQPVRLFVVNAGPSHFSAFHVIGTIMENVFVSGNPANELHGLQTVMIGPGDGAMTQFTVQQAGRYTFVTHVFGDADLGGMGVFTATAAK